MGGWQGGGVGFEAPDIGGERAFFGDQFLRAPGVVDDRFDLAAVAHDACVGQQAGDVAVRVAGDAVEIEAMEGAAEVVALGEDGAPAQAGLEALQAQLFEQAPVVIYRKTPFGVVVGEELGRGAAPAAARLAVGAGNRLAHRRSRRVGTVGSVEQKAQPRVDAIGRDLENLGEHHAGFHERVLAHARIEVSTRYTMGEQRAARGGLQAAHQQQHAVVDALLNPGIVGGHQLGGAGLVVGKAQQYHEHGRAPRWGVKVRRGRSGARQRGIEPVAQRGDFPADEGFVVKGGGERGHALAAGEHMQGQRVGLGCQAELLELAA